MSKTAGFTLAESLAVLAIVSFFTLLPLLALQRWQEILNVQQFLARFEKSILVTQQLAITDKTRTQFFLTPDQRSIYFSTSRQPESQLPTLMIPQELTVNKFPAIAFVAQTGNNSKMETITFQWKAQRQTIQYKFQFGSGHYQKVID